MRVMKQLNVYEAKTQLSNLLDQVSKGATFIIAKSGIPLAKLSALKVGKRNKFKIGAMKGKVKLARDFDTPLPDDVIELFERGKHS